MPGSARLCHRRASRPLWAITPNRSRECFCRAAEPGQRTRSQLELRLSAQHLPVRCLALPARQERTVFLLLLRLSWCHGRLWGRIGAADGRNLGDSSGQQGITNLEVSGRLTAIHLRRETAGLGFHTAEARADSFRELCDASLGRWPKHNDALVGWIVWWPRPAARPSRRPGRPRPAGGR